MKKYSQKKYSQETLLGLLNYLTNLTYHISSTYQVRSNSWNMVMILADLIKQGSAIVSEKEWNEPILMGTKKAFDLQQPLFFQMNL